MNSISLPAFIIFEDDPLAIATMEAYYSMMGGNSTEWANKEKLYAKIVELREKRDQRIKLDNQTRRVEIIQPDKPCYDPIGCSRDGYCSC